MASDALHLNWRYVAAVEPGICCGAMAGDQVIPCDCGEPAPAHLIAGPVTRGLAEAVAGVSRDVPGGLPGERECAAGLCGPEHGSAVAAGLWGRLSEPCLECVGLALEPLLPNERGRRCSACGGSRRVLRVVVPFVERDSGLPAPVEYVVVSLRPATEAERPECEYCDEGQLTCDDGETADCGLCHCAGRAPGLFVVGELAP